MNYNVIILLVHIAAVMVIVYIISEWLTVRKERKELQQELGFWKSHAHEAEKTIQSLNDSRRRSGW